MPDNEKILIIISDFFLATKGNYSIRDIDLLKSIMGKLGINPDDKISMLSLYDTLISNNKIAEKLFEAIDKAKFKELDYIETPLLGNLKKLKLLENEEKYIVDSVVEMSKLYNKKGQFSFTAIFSRKPCFDIKDIQLNLLKYYAKNNLNMNLEKDNSYFDLSVAIINELSNIDNVEIAETEEVNIKKIPTSTKNYYDTGIKLIMQENFEGGLFFLKKALENGMNNSEIYESLAKASLYLGELDELQNYYKLAIERGATTCENYYKFGISLFIKLFIEKQKENNYEEVIKALEKAIELSDKSAYIYNNLGVVHRILDNYGKAIEYYDKAIEIDKRNALVYYNKAEALERSGGNRFLIEEYLNKAIVFDNRYKKEVKDKNGLFYKDLSKLECAFYVNWEDKFELEMFKRLNSLIEFEKQKE